MSAGPARHERVGVAVVGTVNLDRTVHVAHLPAVGETVVGEHVGTSPGGKGANQAVAAARQGATTALIGCVGDDTVGAEVLAFLGAEPNLVLDGLRRVPGPTGSAFVTVDAGGANTVVSARAANAALDEVQVHRHGPLLATASVLLVQLGVPRDAVDAALSVARSVGTITVLDPSPAGEVTDDLLRLADVCTPNEAEAEQLSGVAVHDLASARRAAERVLARGCASVVITRGRHGAFYAAARGHPAELVVEPIAVEVVDPTGAGDAFCGALAAALAAGQAIEGSLARAAVAGGLATTRAGAARALPTAAEVDAHLRASGRVARS